MPITVKTAPELELMRTAGRIVGECLAELGRRVKPGVTTGELDRFAYEYFTSRDCVPAFKGYHGYPATICSSVNEQVVHGIPGPRVLVEGDVVGIDIGAYWKGYCGDSARTFPVGKVSAEAKRLLEATWRALDVGIAQCVPGQRVGDIGHAVENWVVTQGFTVVRDYVGHGIGRAMHEDPRVPNYGKPRQGPKLVEGMCLALEPMVNQGQAEVRVLPDGWTVVTRDGSISAHFEDSVAVTPEGPVNLTRV